MTKANRRCRNYVFDGQEWTWDVFGFARLGGFRNAGGRLLSQTCHVHDSARAAEHQPAEWQFFPWVQTSWGADPGLTP